jgi:hypothetical protein
MPAICHSVLQRRFLAGSALFLSVAVCVQCTNVARPAVSQLSRPPSDPAAAVAVVAATDEDLSAMAAADPLAFLQYCWERYQTRVRDYRCTFRKQELVGDRLLPEQEADLRIRQQPFSVDMTFTRNPGQCGRALYVAGKWQDSDGNELAWAKPSGAILQAFVPRIKQPIRGPRAQKESRRSIDQIGFDKSFELIVYYARKAAEQGVLDMTYAGLGTVGDRRTYVLERRLPYTGEEYPYPDALLVIHIDREYLLPVSCCSYADTAGTQLLGSYVYSDVQLNPGYTDADFDPDLIGF